ncbi:hypothetical protein KL928_001654 [Ogataea angusta]|uniref:Uncharacterized protein n=1 Tax=Pichia angusta TaxID=870730 RepID=A0AAN6DIY3_PICAN|nr:uncharacterized protein KL928_001654 [Ogataea angusta]KAG7820217.1 hypothetical protein KL928_001654 [Ogataea angusta]
MEAPDPTKQNHGSASVTTEGGQIRIRKGQSYEDFLIQKNRFLQEGPIINELGTFMEIPIGVVNLCSADSIIRGQIVHSLERRYYLGHFEDCLNICDRLISKLELESSDKQERKQYEKLFKQLADIQERCLSKLTSTLTTDEERKT